MLKDYLKTAWSNLVRNKVYSAINISGIAIGMVGAVLILLWLQNEISFDKFHAKKNNLYEVHALTSNTDGHPRAINETSQPHGPALKQNYPEVEASARVRNINGFLLTAGDKSYRGKSCG